ncbi:MAG: FAD-dependent oxidoreductase [Clostridium sp.]|nr:FAD-dependent oxidoreductase [Clostridium sp.]
MNKKKVLCLLLTSVMLLSATACGKDTKDEGKNKYTPGVYTINTNGMKGEMTVEVTFDDSSITDIKVVNHSETYGIGYGMDTTPIEVLPKEIIKTQSLNVDTVTGATLTSKFLLQAVKEAVVEAGGDPEKLPNIETSKSEGKTYDVDVVVVGGGVAGLSAAIEASQGGADVLILEKQGIVGGATTRSGGKLMANGTEYQKEANMEDSNEEMFAYLKKVGGDLIDDSKVKNFVDNSLETFNWMEDLGVEVQDVEPIHSSLTPWRVHNTKGGGGMTDGHGGQIIVPMLNKYNEVDGDILYNVTANELITNSDKEIVGVKGVNKDGSLVTVNAKSVILATGGYASNREMMAKYEDFTTGYSTQVPAGNIGDGITMAETVGGQIYENPSAQTVYVSYTSGVGINEEAGLIVSEDGKRFVNEYTYQYHVGDAMYKEKSSLGYYIATSNDPTPTVQYAMTLDTTTSASSIEELASLINIDPATLKSTVDRYNELCAKGVDEDFGKQNDKMYPIEGEKYFAIKLNPAVTVTFSGIVTDLESRVLDANNAPIKGLYAAGETAFPGLFGTEYPGCGVAISAGSFYGRVAGQNAASEK